jgi:spermidine synthase
VVAAFMAGLALGSWLLGRRADRVRFPLRLFGWVEAGIGGYALLFLPVYSGLQWVCLEVPFLGQGSFFARCLWRFLLAMAVLLLPTVLMGGTFPILARFLARSPDEVGSWTGRLYAFNTVGGVLGVFAGGLLLPAVLGLRATLWLAGLTSLSVGLTAILLSRRHEGPREEGPAPAAERSGLSREVRVLAAALFLSGLAALSYEILWSRLLGLVLGSSIYAFTLILAIYLAGLALGAWAWATWGGKRSVGPGTLALLQAGIAFFALLTFPLVNTMPYWVARFLPGLHSSFLAVQGFYALLIAVLLLAATVLMGATIPAGIQMVTRSDRGMARRVGALYAFNTMGAILGSFLAGFVLIPQLGIRASFLLTAAVSLGTGLLLLVGIRHPRGRTLAAAGLVTALLAGFMLLLPPLNVHRLAEGSHLYFKKFQPYLYNPEVYDFFTKEFNRLPFYRDGLSCTVGVLTTYDGAVSSLILNGKADASNAAEDMISQVLLAYVPMALYPDASRVLIIGMGSGVTLGSVLEFPVREAVQVELEAEVVRASRFFKDKNGDCLADGRTALVVEDGRNYLQACREPFDIIISEPSNPWMPGVANLFSVESFRLLKEKTRSPGIVCQWLQLYNMDPRDVKTILKGFHAVFPDMAVFHTSTADLLLIGFKGAFTLNPQRAEETLMAGDPGIQRKLREIGFPDVYALWEWSWIGDGRALRGFWDGPGPLNTDDRPVLEARAAARIYRDMARPIYDDLRSRAVPLPMERWLPDPRRRAAAYRAAAQVAYRYMDPFRGYRYMKRALALDPENADYRGIMAALEKKPATMPSEPTPAQRATAARLAEAEQFRAAGQTDREREVLQALEAARVYVPLVHVRLAELDLQGGGDLRAARRRLLTAICMSPLQPAPHMLLSTVYARLGEVRRAELEQERYLELLKPAP